MIKPQTRRQRLYWIGGFIALLIVLSAADYLLYPRLSAIGGRSFNTGQNASWLHYSWYFGEAKESPGKLVERLNRQQIRYAYFHVRYIKKDGTLRYRDAKTARRLTDALHAQAPAIKRIAWVYIGNERGLTGVDLSDGQVRKTIVQEAAWLVGECGFDGVQWDYEICEDGNQGFLSLLRESRKALPKDALISVSTAMWLPGPLRQWGWSEEYFAQIAAPCDQIAVMVYDSGLYWPRHYVWLMRQQAIRVTRSVARGNPKCRVILGVPTYEEGGPSHHRYAENIDMAIKGIREGLADSDANRSAFEGIGIFADYTTDDDEWQRYRSLWLN